MAYEKTIWVDEIPDSTPIKYEITDDSEGALASSASIELVTPIATPGTPFTAANMNNIEDGIETNDTAIAALASDIGDLDAAVTALETAGAAVSPRTRVYRSTSQTIVRVTPTAIIFDTERYDTDGGWSSGQPTRLTVPEDGVYAVGGHVQLLGMTTAIDNYLALRINGTQTIALQQGAGSAISNNPTTNILVPAIPLVAGDYVELLVNHTDDSDRNTGAGTASDWNLCDFWFQRLTN